MRKPVKKVFLSYGRADEKAAREISASLKNAGFEVWDPAREILPASNFAASLQDALNTADAMVVLLSPDFSGSKYLQYEVEFALGTERFSGRLIPVLLRNLRLPFQPQCRFCRALGSDASCTWVANLP
jgi:TIR domain